MRQSVQLGLVGAAVVYLAFFSWPVPSMVKDVLHTDVGKFVVLGGIAYLAMYQSVTLAILATVFYVKSVHSAYHEGFTAGGDTCKDRSKLSGPDKKACAVWDATKSPTSDPTRAASGGGVPSSKGSSAGATGHSSGTEHYENFASF